MRFGPPCAVHLLVAAALLGGACTGDPIRELVERRAGHSAELGGFLVRDEPGAEHPTIVLDVLVRGDGRPPLAGITLDVSMAGPDGQEKAHRRVWVDTSGLDAGGLQTTLTLEGLVYAPGDGFWVEVRSPVPAAERGEYREFGDLGGGGG